MRAAVSGQMAGSAVRIVNFKKEGRLRLGIVTGNDVVDPSDAAGLTASEQEYFASTTAFIAGGEAALAAARSVVAPARRALRFPLAETALGPPITPSTMLCAGSNYRNHNREKANTPLSGKEPEFFIKTSDCVIGPDEPIIFDPRLTQKLDCETELAIVIGKPGRHIPAARALSHVFGYTIVNDVTARDRQVRSTGNGMTWYELGRGKAFDTSAPIGPVIVTADEVGNPQALQLSTRINGELRQSTTTAEMIWSCAELIHFFSTNFTLRPGMVIITGTPAGTAWSNDKELGGEWQPNGDTVPASRYCLPGDIVESRIERIGVLRNRIELGA